LLSSPNCGPCEVLKKLLGEILEELEDRIDRVELREVDVIDNPDFVLKYGILTTPALAINGKLCFVGVPKRKELLGELLTQGRVL